MSSDELIPEIKEQVQEIRKNFNYPNDGTAFGHFALRECFYKIMDFGDVAEPDLDDFIKKKITDGKDDKGIDAVIVESDGVVNFFQFKYSDWNQYDNVEFKKTMEFFDTLFDIAKGSDGGPLNIDCNAKLRQLIEEDVKPALKERKTFKMHYVGAYFGEEIESSIENLEQRYLRHSDNLTFLTHKYQELQALYEKKGIQRNKVKLKFIPKEFFAAEGKFHLDGQVVPVKKFVGSITAESLNYALKNYGRSLFDVNVRYFKGFAGDVNKSIKKEYEQGPNSNFWFLNNGLNAICKNFEYNNDILTAKDFQIANGCQTSKALQEVLDVDPSITILLRLTAIKDTTYIEKISSQIAIASNKQNPINNRDLHANDSVQGQIFKLLDEKRIFYDYKESSWREASKSKYKTGKYSYNKIKNVDVAISYMSLFLQIPVLSKGREKLAFSDEADYYRRIFDESHGDRILVKKLMLAYRLREYIEKLRKEYSPKYPDFLGASNSTDIILALLGLGLLKLQGLSLSKEVDKLKDEMQKLDVTTLINDDYELKNEDYLKKTFELIAYNINTYLVARRDSMEEKRETFSIQNWIKAENNYPKLVNNVEPLIAHTTF